MLEVEMGTARVDRQRRAGMWHHEWGRPIAADCPIVGPGRAHPQDRVRFWLGHAKGRARPVRIGAHLGQYRLSDPPGHRGLHRRLGDRVFRKPVQGETTQKTTDS